MVDNIKENQRKSAEKIARGEYDVFISYNHKDRERVIGIGELLKSNGIAPWLDEWDLQPGLPWQPLIEQQIKQIKAAAVFVGEVGLGSWQKMEIDALLRAFVRRGCPVIPVLLENAPREPELPVFLEGMTWVDFRKKDPDPLERLIWGITGKRQGKIYRPGILIASLGDSPVVVPSMYRLLTEEEQLSIEQVTILHPTGADIQMACELIDEFFPEKQKLRYEAMTFNDADSWLNACLFLQKLCALLDHYQKQGETVYLSLAGGRKSMAALMAWVIPFFSCVQKLYHVIDHKEQAFPSVYEIQAQSTSEKKHLMYPALGQLSLIEIPFERAEHISETLLSRLLSSRPTDYEKAEALITGQAILQQGDIKQLSLTALAAQQFRSLLGKNRDHAQKVRNGLLEMCKTEVLQMYKVGADTAPYHPAKFPRIFLHSFTGLQVPIHPIFYTLPKDVYTHPDAQVEQVVICSLETPDPNGYKTIQEITASPNFSHKSYSSIDALPSVPSPTDSVLIVPLGKSPMVATQLYTLLKEQEQHTIHEVVLIYPQLSVDIQNSVDIIREALREEYNFKCTTRVDIPGLRDITSKEDCQLYQEYLETEIKRVKQQYPDHKIDLALSGGRKGMTAMTIFAAQKNHIPYVYHTLISNEKISEKIEKDTTIEVLKGLSKKVCTDRLFLRAYKPEGDNPYAYFTLFRVPVFTADGL